MKPLNVLLLFSDEHRRDALGCYGHPLVKTPNLDQLAKQGTRFSNAYTPSPICVPARAALATGQYVHQTRCWSNAQAYAGEPNSWGHQLIAQGHQVDSIGKLHYRGADSDNGFQQEILPLYIKNGTGWVKGLLRDHEAVLNCVDYAEQIGPESDQYTDYDLGVTQAACEWLQQQSKRSPSPDKPWTLFVSWLRPHYPLTCPVGFYEQYPLEQMDQARFLDVASQPQHPVVQILKKNFNYDVYFNEETRQIARASYYGLCSFLDHQIGQVLKTLKDSGQAENTLIIYTSDHGDHNGDRRMWTKMSLFDEASSIPMIISGPGIPCGKVVDTLASLVDIYPSILSATGAQDNGKVRPGIALQQLANRDDSDRHILSEYHDGGSPTGMFMLRTQRWKYNYYPGYSPELYDMQNDPQELNDLGTAANHANIREQCHQQMLNIVDPEQQNQQALADQAERIAELGGMEAIIAAEDFDFTPVGS